MPIRLSSTFPAFNMKHPARHETDEEEPSKDGESMISSVAPIIYLHGTITQDMAEGFVRAIEQLKAAKLDGCVIDIASHGGSVLATMQMLSAMRSCSNVKFITYCSSHAYSAAAVLLACGSPGMRIMSPFGSAMIHPVSVGLGDQGIEDHKVDTAFFEELNDRLLMILSKNMKSMSVTRLKKKIRDPGARTWYMFPEEAKEVGLVDEIGIPDIQVAPALHIQVLTADLAKVSKA